MNFKKFVSILLCLSLFLSITVQADCDFSKGITPGPNKTYIYSEICHQKVGQIVKRNKDLTQANSDLMKAISLKDVALQDSDKRADIWNKTAENLENRLQKVDTIEKKNEWIYFGLGVLVTGMSVWLASKAIGR